MNGGSGLGASSRLSALPTEALRSRPRPAALHDAGASTRQCSGLGGGLPALTHSGAVNRAARGSHSSAGRPACSPRQSTGTVRSRAGATPAPAQRASGLGAALARALRRRARALGTGPRARLSRPQRPGRPRACPREADTGLHARGKPTRVYTRETALRRRRTQAG